MGSVDVRKAVTAERATDKPVSSSEASGAMADTAVVTIIKHSRGWASFNLRELWEYRDLLFFLAWRDISVRYKQTVLGAAGHRYRARADRRRLRPGGAGPARQRRVLLPAHGKDVCGCGVMGKAL